MHDFDQHGDLLPEEYDTLKRLEDTGFSLLDMDAISVVTNVYRLAQGLRNKMEQEVLRKYRLSWTAFSLLYDLWIHTPLDTKALAVSAGVSNATISNIVRTLEEKDLCYRKSDLRDRRLTHVYITAEGTAVLEELYPLFHQKEAEIVQSLSTEEQQQTAKFLRRVIREQQF